MFATFHYDVFLYQMIESELIIAEHTCDTTKTRRPSLAMIAANQSLGFIEEQHGHRDLLSHNYYTVAYAA